MNVVERMALAAEPVPVAPGGVPARACVVQGDGDTWRTAWLVGVTKEPFGEPYPTARAAAAASAFVNERGDL